MEHHHFVMGKLTINAPFSMAVFNYQKVQEEFRQQIWGYTGVVDIFRQPFPIWVRLKSASIIGTRFIFTGIMMVVVMVMITVSTWFSGLLFSDKLTKKKKKIQYGSWNFGFHGWGSPHAWDSCPAESANQPIL